MSLKNDLIFYARKAGGGDETIGDRVEAMKSLLAWLRAANLQFRQVKHLNKVGVIRAWADSHKHLSPGSQQNLLAHLRATLRAAGMEKFADHRLITNKALGLPPRSRLGTKTALTADEYRAAIAKADSNPKYVRELAALRLERFLNLRRQEAVRSSVSLKDWLRQLQRGRMIHVVHGTKGGKARDQVIPAHLMRFAVKAITEAIALCEQHPEGYLIDKPDLEHAKARLSYVAETIGLKGEKAEHALRYTWAHDAAKSYIAEGYTSRAEILAMVSLDLGHGDGRGRYTASTYLQGFEWPDNVV